MATFSLIASLASKLASISVELDCPEFGGALCQIMTSVRPELFAGVRFLRLDTRAALFVRFTPSLEVLDVIGSWNLNMHLIGEQHARQLHTLRISNATYRFATISAFCRRGNLPSLKIIALNKVKRSMFLEDVEDETEELIVALRDHCPHLIHFEALRWEERSDMPSDLVVSGLDRLASLETLIISVVLFGTGRLPPNITSLTLDELCIARVTLRESGEVEAREGLIQCIMDAVSTTRVKTLTVIEDEELHPVAISVLKDLSARLQAGAGVKLRVSDGDDDVIIDKS
jgi:hypothetical protein